MSGRTFIVEAAAGAYEVLVGPGLLDASGAIVRRLMPGDAVALVTDSNVAALYGDRAVAGLEAAGVRVHRVVIPPGEGSKSWERAGAVLDAFAGARLTRDDAVVALGGGVVGDMAGFCAATYMRGLRVAQVPTTLLAQVDSAIGGKTAVDLPAGKNLVGAFWPPVGVIADTSCLATLPDVEWSSGMAEVAKAAVLDGPSAVSMLEADARALMTRAADAVDRAVLMAVAFKAGIVSSDEREGGERESLNYGHTLGHALERVAGYGVIPHGAAVAEGIRFAAMLAERVAGADPAWSHRQDGLLTSLGSPHRPCAYPAAALLAAMHSDKKVKAGTVRFVMCTEPGIWQVRPVSDKDLSDGLSAWCGA